jgi:ubiquinol-cytochrome c reductase iron-sulfur subunit
LAGHLRHDLLRSMSKSVAIALALALAFSGSVLFIAAYATGGDRLYEGLSLALAAAGLCAAALGWAFWIVPPQTVVDDIVTYPSAAQERRAQSDEIVEGVHEIARPRMLLALLGAALASFAAALVVPIRSLGPAPDEALFHTRWRRGVALVREDGSLVHAGDLNLDSAIAVFPQNALDDAQSQATLIRLPGDAPGSVSGYVAYSRLCTHAGCPVALYRAQSKELICPCHQSVFDVAADGAVVSGPADHALPRLPIAIGRDGVLRATADFPQPVGPGFWERG